MLEQSDVDSVIAIAKAKGWSNDDAQATLTEMHEQLVAQRAQLRTELQAHPEIGGTNLEVAQQHAQRALNHFLPAESPEGKTFRAAMTKSGYGDYAPLVLLLSRIGKAMSEDRPIAAGGGALPGALKPTSDVLFPSSAKS